VHYSTSYLLDTTLANHDFPPAQRDRTVSGRQLFYGRIIGPA